MALTRPKIWDLDTNIEYFKDPITVLHQGATQANVDVGFVFNRANGLVSNVALYWSESAQSIVTAYTTSTGTTDSNVTVGSYANLTVGNVLLVNGSILNVTGSINANISNTGNNYFGNVTYGNPAILNGSSTITSIGTGAQLLDSFSTTSYRSAKYILSITDVTNTGYQTSEILLMQDGTNANISSYALLYTSTSAKMTFSSNIISGNLMLWGTGVSANNTVKLVRTLIPV